MQTALKNADTSTNGGVVKEDKIHQPTEPISVENINPKVRFETNLSCDVLDLLTVIVLLRRSSITSYI